MWDILLAFADLLEPSTMLINEVCCAREKSKKYFHFFGFAHPQSSVHGNHKLKLFHDDFLLILVQL
jgi:hypothetical protein